MFLTDADLAGMRADAIELLPDRCELRHPDTHGDDGNGHETSTPGAIVATWHGSDQIPCAIATVGTSTAEFADQIGGQDVTSRRYILSLPVEIGAGVDPGMVATLVASTDPYLAGRRVTVMAISGRTGATLRRVLVDDNLG